MLSPILGHSPAVGRDCIARYGIKTPVSLSIITILALSASSCQRYTPDDDLMHLLSARQSEFHELLEMAQADADIASITPKSVLDTWEAFVLGSRSPGNSKSDLDVLGGPDIRSFFSEDRYCWRDVQGARRSCRVRD